MRYGKGEKEVSHTCLEVVGGDCWCNLPSPIWNCVKWFGCFHNSTATKNTSLQSVRDIMVIAIP